MSWEQTLLDASFRGVKFDVIDTDDSIERAISVSEFPYVDGGDPKDLGAKPWMIAITAIFFGPDYEARLSQFMAEAAKPGVGELVHPIFGTMQAQLAQLQVKHTAEQRDACIVALKFIQKSISARVFTGVTPRQAATAIPNATSALRDLSAAAFLRGLQSRFKQLTTFPQINAVLGEISGITSALRSLSPAALLSGLSIIDFPLFFLGDVRNALGGLFDFPDEFSGARFGISDWTAASGGYSRAAQLDVPRSLPAQPVRAVVDDMILRESAIEQANVAAQVFALEADEPVLNPTEIQRISNDTRATLQLAIISVRATYPLETSHAVADGLRTIAWQVQDAALQVLAERPPLITRTVPDQCNLRLLAHWWYQDHSRASELLRLNPSIRNPNFVAAGEVLNAFAR